MHNLGTNKPAKLILLIDILQDLLTPRLLTPQLFGPLRAPTTRIMSLRHGLLLLTVAFAAVHHASADAGKIPRNAGVQDL